MVWDGTRSFLKFWHFYYKFPIKRFLIKKACTNCRIYPDLQIDASQSILIPLSKCTSSPGISNILHLPQQKVIKVGPTIRSISSEMSWWKFMTEKKRTENFLFLEKLISEGWYLYQRNPHPFANPNIQFLSPMYDLKRQGSPKCPGDWLSFEYYEKSRIYTLRFAQSIALFLV